MATSSQPSPSAGTRVLPTGTVTFLFSDIEGSTQRWEMHREAMESALARHDALLRTSIEAHRGFVFKTMGDEFCAVFASLPDAIAAALNAQLALQGEDFSAVDGLRVRMALHAGENTERKGDYFGPTINRVARLLAIAHGGQVLLSGAAADLSHGEIPPESSLRDLGFAQLRDLSAPEHVWQLDITGLPNEFPPLRSLDTLPNNLPIQRTTFVGRESGVAEVKALVEGHRLLTLVGSGGVGKTRLAIQVGAELLDRFPDGVWFVDLAPITDPELVASVVAQALGMSQQQGQRIDESIPAWLKRKQLLLILDNCEHVVEPVGALADAILATAQDVRILATSRQGLDISGEAVHRLPSLVVPPETGALKRDEALRYGAVALFVDRAMAADTRFVLTDDTAPIVAEICRRLDGIALAIELAAARVKVLSIPHLARRLSERFKLLTGGSRSALPRQKTLTALIDWSYDLLNPQEQFLFARLGVFAGGFGLDDATAVCGGDGLEASNVFDLLASLTDKSLVVADTSGAEERYRLLESMAAYALEKLAASGERERTARRHAERFREQAEAVNEQFGSRSTIGWLASVKLELDNYRTALEWALTQGNDAVLGGAIASALTVLWWYAGLVVEGRYWIELALPRILEAEQPRIAARLQGALSVLSIGKRRYDTAKQAMKLYESVGDVLGAARARRSCVVALYQMGWLDEALETAAQALAALRACGDMSNVAQCLSLMGDIEMNRGEFRAGRELYRQALAGMKELGDDLGTARQLGSMAELEFAAGDPEQALRYANEALELDSIGKNLTLMASWHLNSTAYRIALGDVTGARESAREALLLTRQVHYELDLAIALQHLALLAALDGDAQCGAQLLGYVDAQYNQLGMKRESTEQWGYDKLLTALRDTLNDDKINKLAVEGAAWTEDRAIETALTV